MFDLESGSGGDNDLHASRWKRPTESEIGGQVETVLMDLTYLKLNTPREVPSS